MKRCKNCETAPLTRSPGVGVVRHRRGRCACGTLLVSAGAQRRSHGLAAPHELRSPPQTHGSLRAASLDLLMQMTSSHIPIAARLEGARRQRASLGFNAIIHGSRPGSATSAARSPMKATYALPDGKDGRRLRGVDVVTLCGVCAMWNSAWAFPSPCSP